MKINSSNTVSLGEVLEYEQPTKYIVDNTNYDDEFDIPVLTAGKSFLLGYTNETHNVFSNVPVIIFDDFTTAFKYVDFPFKVKSSAMKILKAKKEVADIRFLYYRMMKTGIDTELHKRYWISKYSKVKIPLPPLDQQKKIAAILDAADAYRQKTKALITKYDDLTQSLFLDMFGDPVSNPMGWNEVIFTEVLVLRRGFDLPRQDRIKGEYPIMASNGILDWHNEFKVEGPGVVTGRSGTLGKVHYIEGDYWPLNTALYSQKLNGNNPIYLIYLIRNFRVERFSRGAGVPTLNRNLVHAETIMTVPIELQNKFAERVQAIEAQKAQAQASLAQAKDLFNSLLQKAFKGELV